MIVSKKTVRFTLAAIATGVIAGWSQSHTKHADVSDNDVWQTFETSIVGQKDIAETVRNIKTSGIIRKFPTREEEQKADVIEAEKDGLPPLPEIIGTSVVNGIPQVHIKMPDAPPISLVQGDTLESGWLVETVNLNGIILKYEDVEQSVLVKDYDLTPEDTINDGTSGKTVRAKQ